MSHSMSHLHSRLVSQLNFLPSPLLSLGIRYAKTCFAKTKTTSHLSFLRTCVRKNIIPKGFRLQHSPSDLQDTKLLACTNKILHKAGKQLMIEHLKVLEKKLLDLNDTQTNLTFQLNRSIHPALSLHIKIIAINLNASLYQHTQSIKQKKMTDLLNTNSVAPVSVSDATTLRHPMTHGDTVPCTVPCADNITVLHASSIHVVTDTTSQRNSMPSVNTVPVPTQLLTSSIHGDTDTLPCTPDNATDPSTNTTGLFTCHPPTNLQYSSTNCTIPVTSSTINPLLTPRTSSSFSQPTTSSTAPDSPLQDTTKTTKPDQLVYCIPSDLPISDVEISALSKGLKFIPLKASTSKYDIINSCQKFFRSLRWMAVLGHPPKQKTDPDADIFTKLFQRPQHREPPHNTFPEVEHYIHHCLKQLQHLKLKPLRKSNLTKEETNALQTLKARDDIVIKPADKGGAVVVWDRNLYIEEAQKQLGNLTHYQKLNKSIHSTNQSKITKLINSLISSQQLPPTAKLLIKQLPKESVFYLLPKIHKANNPGRPIVSACSCPTENISEFLDSIMQPLVQSLPTFIKDTNHALNLIEEWNANTAFQPQYLFTLDVTSLYTSIPHSDGLQALEFFLNKRQNQQPSTSTLLRLAELVLIMNTFSFGEEVFEQISGVAMGTKMGPSYACLFLGFLEHQILQQYNKPTPELYKRYIDDGLGATSLTHNQLLDYINYVQHFHPSIKFTYNISTTDVSFLDIDISLEKGILGTSVHYKPTDSHSYLDYSSSHTASTKDSIPYSQFLRLRRLCSDDPDFHSKADEMSTFFLHRHYPLDIITQARDKANSTSRSMALHPKPKMDTGDRPIISLLYHPSIHQVKKIILSNWNLLQSDPAVAKIFDHRPMIVYKRDTNLRDMLVRAKFKKPSTRLPGTTPCNNSKCKSCPFICSATDVHGPKSSAHITKSFNCQTYNLVYVIHCTKCSKLYIGETGRTLDTRFKEHLADIRYQRDKPVSNHFNQSDHSIQNIRVKGLWLLFTDNPCDRKSMESHLIEKLGSRKPRGMNERP